MANSGSRYLTALWGAKAWLWWVVAWAVVALGSTGMLIQWIREADSDIPFLEQHPHANLLATLAICGWVGFLFHTVLTLCRPRVYGDDKDNRRWERPAREELPPLGSPTVVSRDVVLTKYRFISPYGDRLGRDGEVVVAGRRRRLLDQFAHLGGTVVTASLGYVVGAILLSPLRWHGEGSFWQGEVLAVVLPLLFFGGPMFLTAYRLLVRGGIEIHPDGVTVIGAWRRGTFGNTSDTVLADGYVGDRRTRRRMSLYGHLLSPRASSALRRALPQGVAAQPCRELLFMSPWYERNAELAVMPLICSFLFPVVYFSGILG